MITVGVKGKGFNMSSLKAVYENLTYNTDIGINVVHDRMHKGEFFTVSNVNLAVESSESIDYLFRVVRQAAHMRFISGAGADSERLLYEKPTITEEGTPLNSVNRNRYSSNESVHSMFLEPTITDIGTELLHNYSPGGNGQGNFSQGSSAGIFEEYILNPGDYLLRITNTSASEQTLGVEIDYYIPGLSIAPGINLFGIKTVL